MNLIQCHGLGNGVPFYVILDATEASKSPREIGDILNARCNLKVTSWLPMQPLHGATAGVFIEPL